MSAEFNKKLIVNNHENTMTTKEMDKTKVELLEICNSLGFTKYKSKNNIATEQKYKKWCTPALRSYPVPHI